MYTRYGHLLNERYEQVYFDEFYKDLFSSPLPQMQLADDSSDKDRYIGIVRRIVRFKDGTHKVFTDYVYDGCEVLDTIVHDDAKLMANERTRMTVIAPVSYAGKRATSKNARYLYALCIEIDNLRYSDKTPSGFQDMLAQIQSGLLPVPTYIVSSGTGLHLYYKFKTPLPCYPEVKESLWEFKKTLTEMLWNKYVTTDYEKHRIQYESTFQAFRMVGTQTKNNGIVECFRTGEDITAAYLNTFVPQDKQIIIKNTGFTRLSLAEARELYPKWYEERVVKGIAGKKQWKSNPALYRWWLSLIRSRAQVGHRYYCLYCLAVYGKKCGIPYKQVKEDAFSLLPRFSSMSVENEFTADDVAAALQAYRTEKAAKTPIDFISRISGIEIPRNKRNGRTRKEHLTIVHAIANAKRTIGENPYGNNGRPTKQAEVSAWRANHPDGNKYQCIKDTGMSKTTVYKWWDNPIEPPFVW